MRVITSTSLSNPLRLGQNNETMIYVFIKLHQNVYIQSKLLCFWNYFSTCYLYFAGVAALPRVAGTFHFHFPLSIYTPHHVAGCHIA